MITIADIKDCLDYNPDTGHLTWIKKIARQITPNTRAGYRAKDGYRHVKLGGKKYAEHRLIWYYVHGEFPKGQIDHINQVRDDNRIENLRDVSASENARNRHQRDSRLQERGIWYCKRRKRYIAEITVQGKKVYQKTFIDIDEAIKQRQAKEIELGLFHSTNT
ncbi:hypothetical protein MOMA_06936 [Moraxella macacae 0408225]|uniref:HNH nuclease domain-containing protein n=1 Tax=Moraxella macacae 0408225 TaxID=1230338 RepID=L2F5H5_9GAMM|nr:HNH endonuclease signature motif containing protein [Moraxella macacae]ELA08277.1 hypothetical protein MOMA_06936 [Moraxella macacae 0408225]